MTRYKTWAFAALGAMSLLVMASYGLDLIGLAYVAGGWIFAVSNDAVLGRRERTLNTVTAERDTLRARLAAIDARIERAARNSHRAAA